MDFELFLAKNGYRSDYEAILKEAACSSSSPHATEWTIVKHTIDEGKIVREIILTSSEEYEIRIAEQGQPLITIKPEDSGFDDKFIDILVAKLQMDKVRYANALVARLRTTDADSSKVPLFLRDAIQDIVAKGNAR